MDQQSDSPVIVLGMHHRPYNLLVDNHTTDPFEWVSRDNETRPTPLCRGLGSRLHDIRNRVVCCTSSYCEREVPVSVVLKQRRGVNCLN